MQLQFSRRRVEGRAILYVNNRGTLLIWLDRFPCTARTCSGRLHYIRCVRGGRHEDRNKRVSGFFVSASANRSSLCCALHARHLSFPPFCLRPRFFALFLRTTWLVMFTSAFLSPYHLFSISFWFRDIAVGLFLVMALYFFIHFPFFLALGNSESRGPNGWNVERIFIRPPWTTATVI